MLVSEAHPPDVSSTTALFDGMWAALVRGGLLGTGAAALALLLVAPPLVLTLVTTIPTAFLQIVLSTREARAVEVGGAKWFAYHAATYALPIAGWTLLWAGSEYGRAWPSVFGFLASLNAPPFLLQVAMLVRCLRRQARVARATAA